MRLTKQGLATRGARRSTGPTRLPEKATPGPKAIGVRAVCTNADPLWKGCRGGFFRFYDREIGAKCPERARSCQNGRKGGAYAKMARVGSWRAPSPGLKQAKRE